MRCGLTCRVRTQKGAVLGRRACARWDLSTGLEYPEHTCLKSGVKNLGIAATKRTQLRFIHK